LVGVAPHLLNISPGVVGVGSLQPLRLKIEINTRDHFSVPGQQRRQFRVVSPWFTGDADVVTYQPNELCATKLRTLFQLATALKREQCRTSPHRPISFATLPLVYPLLDKIYPGLPLGALPFAPAGQPALTLLAPRVQGRPAPVIPALPRSLDRERLDRDIMMEAERR
jgi:hypothetical protein